MLCRRPALFLGLVAALALVLAVRPGRAQTPKPDKAAVLDTKKVEEFTGGTLPPDGEEQLRKNYEGNKELRARVREMEDGKVEVGKEQEPDLDVAAKWYTYQLTWTSVQVEAKAISKLMSELDSELSHAAKQPNTQAFQQAFARALAKNAREVLTNRTRIARMNAARVLWRAAPTGEPEVANALVDVLDHPLHDMGTKYWACKGLQEFLAPDGRMPPTQPRDPALLDRITQSLIRFLDTKFPFSQTTPADEIEGIRALRREAVHALALTQHPALADKNNKLTARPAQVLLRVVRKEGFAPEPGWGEQVEAAIGIGWMQSKFYPGYQPDYAAHEAAYAVVALGERYVDDKSTGKEGWRYTSERVAEAFDNLTRDVKATYGSKDKELTAYIADLTKVVGNVLKLTATKGDVRPGDLEEWLDKHPPKNQTVYKGVEDSKVTPPAPAAEK